MFRRSTLLSSTLVYLISIDATAASRDATDVSAGYGHTCAVTTCGEVDCWGRNDWGQSADRDPTVGPYIIGGPFTPEYDLVSVGQYHTCALDENGRADCWGKGNYGQSADRAGPFVDLDAGFNHNCAIRESNSEIECWGANVHNAVSDAPWGTFEDVSASNDFACAVETGGASIECWGNDAYGQAPAIVYPPNDEAGEKFTQVTTGGYHSCGLTNWNTIYCWGYVTYASLSGYAQELVEEGVWFMGHYGVSQVDAGNFGTMTIYNGDARGYSWPFTSYPVPSNTDADEVAIGYNHWCVREGGDIDCSGSNSYGKANAPAMSGSCPSPFYFPWW